VDFLLFFGKRENKKNCPEITLPERRNMDATMQQFTVSTNRYRKTNRAETFTFDVLNGLGVFVSWHQDKDDDEGERVDVVQRNGQCYTYKVVPTMLIRVVLCLPKPLFANVQDRAVATAMLMHEKFGSKCALSHLDECTKDALLRMIVGPLTQNMHLTPVFVQGKGVRETHQAFELEPAQPFELPFAMKLRRLAPVYWLLQNAQNKTVVELMFQYSTS